MRGPAPDGDKTKKEKSEEPKKPAKKQNQNAVQTEPKKKKAKEESENPPKSDSAFTSTKETGQSLKQKETTLKTVRNGNSRSSKKAVPVSDDSFDLEISPDEIRDARKEEDENLPGQMQFGMEEKDLEESFLEENESEEETLGTSEESLEETADEMPDEVPEDTERKKFLVKPRKKSFILFVQKTKTPLQMTAKRKQTKASVWNLRKKSWNVPER